MQVGMVYPATLGVRRMLLSPPLAVQSAVSDSPAVSPQFRTESRTAGKEEANPYHQWPLRAMAFASDLGTVGHLVNLPKLFWAGWLVATPYYALSVASRPERNQKEEELIYQTTANGVFPLLSAKLGVSLGRLAEQRFQSASSAHNREPRPPRPFWRIGGGLGALAALTPTVCDPLSRWLVEKWHSSHPGSAQS